MSKKTKRNVKRTAARISEGMNLRLTPDEIIAELLYPFTELFPNRRDEIDLGGQE